MVLLSQRAYAASSMVWAMVMTPVWFIVYPKLYPLWKGEREKVNLARVLQRRAPSPEEQAVQKKHAEDEKSAKLALTIGKMYEELGMIQKSIDLFDQALAVWQVDPARETKDLIGSFTLDEINSFTPKDLTFVVQLLIAKGRVHGTFNSADASGQQNAGQSWLDALEIYERAPASADMIDRSIIFPIFSGLFVFIKGEKIQQDKKCNFEQNLASKFVRETKRHGDLVHYMRALAMQVEVKGRLGKYRSALASWEKIKAIYVAEDHSEAISEAYGTDRVAQSYAQACLWYMMLQNEDEAVEACEDVIRIMMPAMDPKNVLNMCEMLLPVIRFCKPRGGSSRCVF
jgi:tetratricopeptide (TPR) repeat protein